MADTKRKVLITGCTDGSLGASLSIGLHNAGFHVYATVRNPAKAAKQAALGIQVLQLDVLSAESIAACVAQVPALDMLINNAGGPYNMPIADIDIAEAKKLFDLNVWSPIAMTQAFLPLLLKAPKGAVIVNHTSIASCISVPFQGPYCASKAAFAMFSNTMRLELKIFGIKVVELKTWLVKSGLIPTVQVGGAHPLPSGSIFEPAKELVDHNLRYGDAGEMGQDPDEWAQEVLKDLLQDEPPLVIAAGVVVPGGVPEAFLKLGQFDDSMTAMARLDEMEKLVTQHRKQV